MKLDPHEDIDRILDDALASYSKVEPRPGLEQRVLAGVRAQSHTKAVGWWRWVALVPVLASLVTAVVMLREKPVPVTKVAVTKPAVVQPVSDPPVRVAVERKRPVVAKAQTAKPRPLPKHGQFPLPAPLSDGERALVALASRFPDQARLVLEPTDLQPIELIKVDKLEIAPLPGGGDPREE